MKITIDNKHLKKTTEFLSGLALTGKASRVRVKLNDRLQEKLQEFSAEFQRIKSDLDESKEKEDYKAAKEQLNEMNELAAELSVVDMTEHAHLLPSLKDELEGYPDKLEGDNAVAHDVLLDVLESEVTNGDALHAEPSSDVEDAQYKETEEIK